MAQRRLLLIYNPVAGQRHARRFEAVLARLRAAGAELTVRPTTARGDAEAFAAAADRAAFDAVIAAGGDGTINEAANGLAAAGADAPPLALLPLGTANVLAAEIGLASDPAAIAATILQGRETRVYAGLANGRRFLQMTGVGFDAEVVAHVSPRFKRLAGKGAYVVETWRQLRAYGFPRFRLTIDGRAFDAASAVIAKGHFYGGRMVCAPDARLAEPRFQVCLFEHGGALAVLRYGAALVLGRLPRQPGIRLLPAHEIDVAADISAPVQGDGDIIARLPLSARIDERPLSLILPG